MKKISVQNKRHLKSQSRRALKKLSAKYKTKVRIRKLIRKTGNRTITEKKKHYSDVHMPNNMSFLGNPEELLRTINEAKNFAKKRTNIRIELSHVDNLTIDSVSLLTATLSTGDFKNIHIQGNCPTQPEPREVFLKSGFYRHVKSSIKPDNNTGVLLHQRSNKKVNTSIAKEVCLKAIKNTFHNTEIFEPLYDILIECMSNTHNHADIKSDGVYDWWIHLYPDQENRISYFSFLDLGIGIFESISVVDYKQALRDIGVVKNIQLVEDLFKGKIKSRTGRPERGKGIPQIHGYSRHPNVKNMVLITNNVFVNMSKDVSYEIGENFSGTFYYWELHP